MSVTFASPSASAGVSVSPESLIDSDSHPYPYHRDSLGKSDPQQQQQPLTMISTQNEWQQQTGFDPHPTQPNGANWSADTSIALLPDPSLELSSPSAWPNDDEQDQEAIITAMATDPLANGIMAMDWQPMHENTPSVLSPTSTIAFPTPPLLFNLDPIQTPASLPITAVASGTSANPTAGQTSVPQKPVRPSACIRCRYRKISCDAVRPCSRCVHAGETCMDRTEEEIRQAKKRQGKRKPVETTHTTVYNTNCDGQALAIVPTIPISPIPPLMPAASHPPDSFEAYSALTLQAALRLQHMPLLWWLYEHVQVNNRTAELARLFQWKTCLETYLAGMCDGLTVSDSGLLLSSSLPIEVLRSPEWMRSPFARYVQPATRRLYHEVSAQQSPVCCFHGDLRYFNPSNAAPIALQTDATVPAQLLVEWLPEAQTAWEQLESLDASQALFDRSALKRQRIGCNADVATTTSSIQSQPTTPSDTQMPFLDSIATKLAHKLVHGDTNVIKGSPVANPAVVAAGNSSSPSNLSPASTDASSSSSTASTVITDHVDNLNSHFGRVMSVTDAHQPDDVRTMSCLPRVYQHATWCPRHAVWNSHTKEEVNSSLQPSSVSMAPLVTNSIASVCLCSLSTPFPCRVVVNSSFERVTGWSQSEIVSQWSSEYLAAIRVLLHPNGWANFVDDLQQQRMYAFNLLREAIRSAEGEAVDVDTLKSVAQRNPRRGAVEVRPFCSNSLLRNKWSGQPVPCLMTKFMGHEVEASAEDQDQSSSPSHQSPSSTDSSANRSTGPPCSPPHPPRPRRFLGFIVQLEIKSA